MREKAQEIQKLEKLLSEDPYQNIKQLSSLSKLESHGRSASLKSQGSAKDLVLQRMITSLQTNGPHNDVEYLGSSNDLQETALLNEEMV